MAYKKLSDLTTRGHNWNIQVKVMRMWDSVNPTTDELISLDMIHVQSNITNRPNNRCGDPRQR